MSKREIETQGFLKTAGWGTASRKLLAGDASARRYDRICDPETGNHAVLMDSPSDQGENIAPFLQIAEALLNMGYSAPGVFAANPELGLAVIEDLGDDLFARLTAKDPSCELTLYQAAVDVLVDLQAKPPPLDLPTYGLDVYVREAMLVPNWYIPAATGKEWSDRVLETYQTLIKSACARLSDVPPVMVLRDYHAENLLWLPQRDGQKQVGLLDFQDALLGNPAYDLVSLLKDARRDVSPDLQKSMVARYLEQTSIPPKDFLQDYAILGAQRNLKIVGIFARLCKRDHKPDYLALIPRVWAHLMGDLAHPALSDLNEFVAQHIPKPTPETLSLIEGIQK